MTSTARVRVPLDLLRGAIADALWAAVSAPKLPAACVRLGLAPGTATEANSSKRKYVRERVDAFKAPELIDLAQRVLEEYDAPRLQDVLSELTTPTAHKVTDLTRRQILRLLDPYDPLFGSSRSSKA